MIVWNSLRPAGRGGDGGSSARGQARCVCAGITPVIPTRNNSRINPRFDKETHRKRSVVERYIGRAKGEPATGHDPPPLTSPC